MFIVAFDLVHSVFIGQFNIIQWLFLLGFVFTLALVYIQKRAHLDLLLKTILVITTVIIFFSLVCDYTPLCNLSVSPLERAILIFVSIITILAIKAFLDKCMANATKVFGFTIIASALSLLLMTASEYTLGLNSDSTFVVLYAVVINIFIVTYIGRGGGFTVSFKKNISLYSIFLILLLCALEIINYLPGISSDYIEKISTATAPLYFVTFFVCGVTIFIFKEKSSPIQTTEKLEQKYVNKKYGKGLILIVLVLICVSFFVLGTIHLGKFMSVDEPKWVYTRVPQLYDSLSNGEWEKTYINDKPGILPSLLSGITNFFLDKENFNASNFESYLFFARLPILIFNTAMLFLLFFMSKKFLGIKASLVFIALLALNPIIIGISQIINPDSTLWSTAIVSFFAFFAYLKTNKTSFLYFSGIFLGLALTSKFFASVLYITFFLAITLEYFMCRLDTQKTFRRLWDFGKISLISMAVYALLFPATWGKFKLVINGTVGAPLIAPARGLILIAFFVLFFDILFLNSEAFRKIVFRSYIASNWFKKVTVTIFFSGIIFLIANIFLNYRLFDFENVFANFVARAGNAYNMLLAGGTMTILFLPLPILIGLMIFLFQCRKKMYIDNKILKISLVTAIITILIFLGGSSLKGFLATARYQVLVIPFYTFCAAMAFLALRKYRLTFIISIMVFMAYTTISASPFYIQYSNELNYKPTTITEAWGYGGYEIAKELNKLPDATLLNAWVDREGFSQFFVGNTQWRNNINPLSKESQTNYIVLTPGGKKIYNNYLKKDSIDDQTTEYIKALLLYYDKNPDIEFCLNKGYNCVRAIKLDETDKQF